MRHGVDSSHRACKFGLSVSAYSQIREIRSPGRLPSGRRETGAEIRHLQNTGDLATLAASLCKAQGAAYCYRGSVVGVSVCLLDATVSCTETDTEPLIPPVA